MQVAEGRAVGPPVTFRGEEAASDETKGELGVSNNMEVV